MTGPTASPVAERWSEADTEEVVCCVCGTSGRLRWRIGVFGIVRCPVCALVFVSPRLNADALQRLYDGPEYFEGDGATGGVYGNGKRRSAAMLLQRVWTAGRLAVLRRCAPPPATLLEVGSGYGLFLAAAHRAGYAVRGVELSRTGAAAARDRLGLDIFRGQLDDAPIAPADVVCAFDTVEHVPNPLGFLRQVRRRLVPGGTVLLSLPSARSLPARAAGRHWWTLKPEQHLTHFTPSTLRLVAARAGIAVTRVIRSPLTLANAGRLDSIVALGRALPVRDDGAIGQSGDL